MNLSARMRLSFNESVVVRRHIVPGKAETKQDQTLLWTCVAGANRQCVKTVDMQSSSKQE